MKPYAKGYTQGVFDMFHIGHLNLLNNAKKYCETLCVGINTDRLVREYKQKSPIIPEDARGKIVENIKAVDSVILVDTLDKVKLHAQIGFDAVFIGSDWKGTPRWEETERTLKKLGVDVVYLPYTAKVRSTDLRKVENRHVEE